jgi:RNA polymerase sigma factor (sigma-70 family)
MKDAQASSPACGNPSAGDTRRDHSHIKVAPCPWRATPPERYNNFLFGGVIISGGLIRSRGVTVTVTAEEAYTGRTLEESRILAFERQFPELYRVALRPASRILHNRADAEDAAAETLARLYERWEHLRARPELYAWVARVSTNLALDHIKRRKRYPPPPTGQPDISDGVIERIEFAHAIRDLPRRQREVIALRYFADLPDAEVALVLRISHATERTHLRRALAALRPRFSLLKEQLDEL